MININRCANDSTMERFEGITHLGDLGVFKKVMLPQLVKDAKEDGFDLEDILQIFVTYVYREAKKVPCETCGQLLDFKNMHHAFCEAKKDED